MKDNDIRRQEIQDLLRQSEKYKKDYDYEQALDCLQKASRIARETNDDELYAECCWKIGSLYWRLNKFKLAQAQFKQAIPLYEALDDKTTIARLKTAIGVTHWNLGESLEAVKLLRTSVYLLLRLRNKTHLRTAYNWLGISYSSIEAYPKALKYFLKGLLIQEELEDYEGIAIAKNSIGLLYLEIGNIQDATRLLVESLQIRRKIGDKEGIADCLNNLGMVYRKTDIKQSLEYYQESLKIRRETGGPSKLANTLNNIGNILLDQKKYDEALNKYNESLVIRKEIGDKSAILTSHLNIADLLLYKGDITECGKILQDSDRFISDNPAIPQNQRLYTLFTEYYKQVENYQKALHYFEKAVALERSNYTKDTAHRIAELRTKFELEKQQRENRIFRLKNVELQNALKTIKSQNEELTRQSENLQLMSRILRHDITNNLSVMHSSMRLYNKQPSEEYLQEIPIQIEKSFELIKKLSKVTYLIRREHFIEKIDVNHVLDKLIHTYRNILFELEGEAEVEADFLLESVFDNLISNAIKHGGTKKIKIRIKSDTGWVIIDVIDFGKGIPDKFKDKVFDESFMYGASGNTGLGLFIVKKAVENYGGTISLRDNEPQGAIFSLKLKRVT